MKFKSARIPGLGLPPVTWSTTVRASFTQSKYSHHELGRKVKQDTPRAAFHLVVEYDKRHHAPTKGPWSKTIVVLPPYARECWATLLGDVRAVPIHYRIPACINTRTPPFTGSFWPSATACVPWPSVLEQMQSKLTPPGVGTHRKSTHTAQELNQRVEKVGPWNSPPPWSQHYVHHTGAPPRCRSPIVSKCSPTT
jgi:hypothetical protein